MRSGPAQAGTSTPCSDHERPDEHAFIPEAAKEARMALKHPIVRDIEAGPRGWAGHGRYGLHMDYRCLPPGTACRSISV